MSWLHPELIRTPEAVLMSLPTLPLTAGSSTYDHEAAVRGVVSSVWHVVWQVATTSPWSAIVLMVPLVAVLVGCTRMSVRRG